MLIGISISPSSVAFYQSFREVELVRWFLITDVWNDDGIWEDDRIFE
jgi:hypothetical protein